MERAFGRSFGDVTVHTGSEANQVTSEQSARALTIGQRVAFSPGAYRPGTMMGDLLIAHELAHVSQQADSREEGHGDASSLEHEADHAAVLALLGRSAGSGLSRSALRLQRCVAAAPAAGAAATGTASGIGLSTVLGAAGIGGIKMLESDTPKSTTDETTDVTTEPVDPEAARRGACYAQYLKDTADCGERYTHDQVYERCMTHAWQNYIRCLNGARRIPFTG
jgi:hypothetical protein